MSAPAARIGAGGKATICLKPPVTQRGNRREPIFFEDGDLEVYRDLLAEQTFERDVEVSGPAV
jgi:hypothetical protein